MANAVLHEGARAGDGALAPAPEKGLQKVCVMGLGYIGLPTASVLANRRCEVIGVDVNPATVEAINRARVPIHEPDLDVLLRSAVLSGQLRAVAEPVPADVFILAVPTPFREQYAPDYSFLEEATRAVAPHLAPGNLLILESTSPVGTTEMIADWLRGLRPDLAIPRRNAYLAEDLPGQLFLAHCPERVLPGRILSELVENDRIIGGLDQASARRARDFYESFVTGRLLLTDSRTAELVKLAENSYRDVNIAFANELSMICERHEISVWELIELANCHPRVNILRPGPGVGGHCIAVDPWFIVHNAPDLARLIRTSREVNRAKVEFVIEKTRQKARLFKEPVIAGFGLTFKADIDDIRESPAVEIITRLAGEGVGRILVVEPYLKELPARLKEFPVELVGIGTALEQANLLLLLVNHRSFSRIARQQLEERVIIDTCGFWH